MALVSFNKLQLFIQEKCSKHFKIDRKDLSRVGHTTVSKILTILSFRPIDSFDGHTFFCAIKHKSTSGGLDYDLNQKMVYV